MGLKSYILDMSNSTKEEYTYTQEFISKIEFTNFIVPKKNCLGTYLDESIDINDLIDKLPDSVNLRLYNE